MNIIWSIIIYSVAGILTGVFASLATAHSVFNTGNSSANILKWVFLIVEIGGFVWFFMNLTKFITLQKNDSDTAAVSSIRTAYIISIAGAILSFIPKVGWIFALICGIASLVLLFMGWSKVAANAPA